jgi:DNA invertase Pin-like site-specific DNA recombinase
METPNTLIGLVRVSTDKQGESGLGLEGQEDAIERFRRERGATLLKSYKEIESGTHDDMENRPQFKAAIAHARRARATLVIAKIDRLVRSTVVMAALKRSGVKFVACDNPYANELTIDILVAVAADEARRISERTKDALRAYRTGGHVSKRIKTMYPAGVPEEIVKATAGKLGASLPQCRGHLTAESRKRGRMNSAAKRKAAALEAMSDLVPAMQERRKSGQTFGEIATWLNIEGQRARRGGPWSATQVKRVMKQAGLLSTG